MKNFINDSIIGWILLEKFDINKTIDPKKTRYVPDPIDNLEAVVTCIGRKDAKKSSTMIIIKGIIYFTLVDSIRVNLNINRLRSIKPIAAVSTL